MAFDATRADLVVGVIGTGAMGRGIAQVAAAGGMNVLMMDSRPGAAREAREFIGKMLARAAEKGSIGKDESDAAIRRLTIVDRPGDLKSCHVVIEAIVENLEAKRQLFAELEGIVAPDCILASNTSSLSVTTIAAKLKTPQRFAGFHFFNPVPLMKLVEVIDGLLTENWVAEGLMTLGRRMGREPVRCTDAPGFLVNQVGRGFTLEAAHLVYEGVAGFADVDRVMRDVGGFRMGPFELMELTGLDVTHPASELIYRQFFEEPRYRPNLIMRARYEAGVLGRKSKKGFYDYDAEMKAVVPAEPSAPAAYPGNVWVSPAEPRGHATLTELLRKIGAAVETGPKPSASALILVTPVGDDATICAVEQELDPKRTVAVDTLFPMARRRTIMGTPITDHVYRNAAHGLLASDGVPVTVCRDSPGFIAQRIVAMIVNIGCSIAQSRTAQPADIDKAVTLGLNYPNGPLKFGDVLGPAQVHRVLASMHRIYGDPRYRPNI
ncbi:MAG TPA: 3-hydroxyacyl-CoA dehydrogenase, partial [Burkholderiales bacterium]|nr:3-hydroxyacyl-CoA dehydrogenase [Burkholderiales bacterium]